MPLDASVAVIPEEYYRKPKGVQFKKSFRSREEAVKYAHERGHRLIIACRAEGCYDVMCDPQPPLGPRVGFELIEDRGELVAVPLTLTVRREEPVVPEEPEPPKSAWSTAVGWLRVHR